jgi:acyl carrier protein
MMAIPDQLKQLLLEYLNVDESRIVPEASFTKDLGADSLDLVELVIALEQKWGISIPDEDAAKLKTVQDAIDYLQGRGAL